ncbi:SLBB domain-containing protein [Desulfobotulus sp.]|uniref:SLBB domain-containing protein n=1 Tax=Desulfobotulus sp. TaxID=1940337 RepID=UPI002A370F63|nr:SLBB domain-containing protein [Desulfobotulus sp.]MDY0164744.1 SLBB domain-containing protein [Desulfobotulus sp.]
MLHKRIFWIFLTLLFCLPAFAIQVTEAEKEAFKKLSPAEQQQVLQQVGGSAPSSTPATETVVPIPVVKPRAAAEPEPEVLQKKQDQRELTKDEAQERELPTRELFDRMKRSREELPHFGYSLFAGAPTTFAPVSDVPVPEGYIIGPGDHIRVQIYGNQNRILDLEVNREGIIQMPDLGPKPVAGLTFTDMRQDLEDTIRRHFIGAQSSITLGKLRSFQVFVLGEAFKPGSYAVSGLATMTHALYVSGGVRETGSLRKIQLRRAGRLVGELDLYDLLLKGDTASDLRLQAGDTVFVPPRGDSVALAGAVIRPGIYEFRKENTVRDLLSLAGGLLPSAQMKDARLLRMEEEHRFSRLDLNTKKDLDRRLKNGDMVQILSLPPQVVDSVVITGHVFQDVVVAWQKDLRIGDILPDPSRLPRHMDPYFAVLRSNAGPFRESRIQIFNPDKALQRDPLHNLNLTPGDEITLFDTRQNRSNQLTTLVSILRSQARFPDFPQVVSVDGAVRFTGSYPLFTGMGLRRLLQDVAMVRSEADLGYVLVRRLGEKPGTIEVLNLNLMEEGEDLLLAPDDQVLVFDHRKDRAELVEPMVQRLRSQASREQGAQVIRVGGRVRFPGIYPYHAGMTPADLIRISGGLLDSALPHSMEISRRQVTDKGALVRHVPVDVPEEALDQFALMAEDHLMIKRIPNWNEVETVTLRGEVLYPGVYPIFKGETLRQVLERAGGVTEYAFIDGVVFLREDLKRLEKERYASYTAQLRSQIAAQSMERRELDQDKNAMVMGLIHQLDTAEPVGRLVIDFAELLVNRKSRDIILKDGDQLFVPSMVQEVTVMGEVQYPTSHLYADRSTIFDYIGRSGGLTAKAAEKYIYVVKADGSVIPYRPSRFGPRNTDISPGDTIIVPFDVEAVAPLVFWGDITKILYQLSTSVAALKVIGVF